MELRAAKWIPGGALKFLLSLRKANRQFAVIGLGRFGRAVCGSLHRMGYEVIAGDRDEKLVARVMTEKIANHAVQLDSTDPTALKQAGIFEFDTVIVAIGNYLEESVITTLNLKEAGVKQVVVKASSDTHRKLLARVGADRVVFPEYEAGYHLARNLAKPSILEHFNLDGDNSIVEVKVPKEFDGKTLKELELRRKYRLNVLAIKHEDKFKINPSPEDRLNKGLAMVVIGSNEDINKLPISDVLIQ